MGFGNGVLSRTSGRTDDQFGPLERIGDVMVGRILAKLCLGLLILSTVQSSHALAGLIEFDSSTFHNMTVTQDDLTGFAVTIDIREGGVLAATMTASVTYGGGTNPFDSGDAWSVGNEFRFRGSSTPTSDTPNETADGLWEVQITPEAGWAVEGITLFSTGTTLANPIFEGLTSDGVATVADANQGAAGELLNNYDDGDAFVDGDDLIFNSGSAANGFRRDDHSELWSYDSLGATELSFTYRAGPVPTISTEGIALDVSLTAVPEPAGCMLLGLADLCGIRVRRRRRRT